MFCANCRTYTNDYDSRSFVEGLVYDDTVTIVQAVEDLLSVTVNLSSVLDPSGSIPKLCGVCIDLLDKCHRHLDEFLKRTDETGIINELINENGKGIKNQKRATPTVIKTETFEQDENENFNHTMDDGAYRDRDDCREPEEVLGLDYDVSEESEPSDEDANDNDEEYQPESDDDGDNSVSDNSETPVNNELTLPTEDTEVTPNRKQKKEYAKRINEDANAIKVMEYPVSTSYECPAERCSKSFQYKAYLLYHTFTHVATTKGKSDRFINCNLCSWRLKHPTRWCMISHFCQYHTYEKTFQCPSPKCKSKFMTRPQMVQHIKAEHNDERRAWKFKCPRCALHFTSEAKRQEHVNQVHTRRTIPTERKKKSPLIIVEEEHDLFSTTTPEDSLFFRTEKLYTCSQKNCSFSISRKVSMLHHCREVHRMTIKPLKCSEPGCGYSSTEKDGLNRHTNRVHIKETFGCPAEGCDYKATSRSVLSRHRTVEHQIFVGNQKKEKERNFCTICSKSFKHPGYLRDHMRMHNGEDPFKCTISGCTFTTFVRDSIRNHLESHDLSRQHLCSHCGSVLSRRRLLKKHIQTKHPEHFPKNVKSYTEKQRVLCSTCGKSFSDSYNLKVHLRSHTGERPFKCKLCDSSFIQKCPLKTHYKKIHGVTMESVDPSSCTRKVKVSSVVYPKFPKRNMFSEGTQLT